MIIGIITIMFALIYFSIINTSNGTDVIGTWDISEDDGNSHVTATLYSDGNMIISGNGNIRNDKDFINQNPYKKFEEDIKIVTIEQGVTSIGDGAFADCTSLTSISIPEGVTSIGEIAFRKCTSLTEIEIPNSVISIGNHAFEKCTSLTGINIPNGVTKLEYGLFSSCNNLKNIKIPEGVTHLENGIFSECSSLKILNIPSSVISIETLNFNICCNCYNLTEIKVDKNNKNYTSENGVLFNKNKTELITYPIGKLEKEYTIPEGVESIKEYAFSCSNNLTNIIIPEGLTKIGTGAFFRCANLIDINIPRGVGLINQYTFRDCWKLSEITLPDTLLSINEYAFINCINLESINIPDSVISIYYNAFSGCKNLMNINIPVNIDNIDYIHCGGYFENISVSKNNNNYIAENGVIFNKQKTKLIKYPPKKKQIEYSIPEGVTSIGERAFYDCASLTQINIPEGVTSIGVRAFESCKSLTNINIPKGVISIEAYTFCRCESLTNINIPERVTSIGDSAFEDCTSLTRIAIPEGVTSIGNGAFKYCISLTSIVIPEGVTSIENNVFYRCTSLTNINIPEGVISIGAYSFCNCESLTNINIPESVTSIGDRAFSGCKNLRDIDIPDNINNLENNVFEDSIINIVFTNANEEIDLPNLIKKAQMNENILYSDEIRCFGCEINSDFTKIKSLSNANAQLKIYSGKLKGLKLDVILSGEVKYAINNKIYYYRNTNKTVNAIIYLAEGEELINNDGNNMYTFTENGEFTFYYKNTNNEQKQSIAKVNCIDKEKPIIEDIVINPNEWTNEKVNVTIDAKDNYLIEEYVFNSPLESYYNSNSFINKNEIYSNLPYIELAVEDSAGNISESRIIAITNIDKQDPIITSIEGNSDNWSNKNIILKINAEDNLSEIKDYSFDGGETWQTSNEKTYSENTENIVIKVRDNAGNIAENEPISITKIDKEKPIIETIEGNPTTWTNRNATIKVTAKDTLTGIKDYSFDGGATWQTSNEKTYEKNTKNIVIKVRDNVGNIVENEPISITKIDKEKSIIENIEGNPTTWTNRNATIKVTAKDTLSGIKDYSFDGGVTWQTSNEKTYEENIENIVIKVRDNVGNITENEPISITKIDKEKPTCSVVYSTKDITNKEVTVGIIANEILQEQEGWNRDPNEKLLLKQYTKNTEESVIIKDLAGNEAIVNIKITNIDKEVPTIEKVEGNPNNWTRENVTLKVVAEDTLSGLQNEAYSFDGGATWQASNEKTYSENTKNIVIKVRDNLGNIAEYEPISITKIDKKAPIIEKVEGNPSNWTKENVTLKVIAEDTLSGIKEYSFDGGVTWQTSNEKTYSENTENIVIKVRDNLGNIAEYEPISITKIDKKTPTIKKVEGNVSNWTKENVTLKVIAEDTLSGLQNEAYSFDGGATWQASNEKTYSENTKNIVIKVRDNAGNITENEPISITKIDKEVPIIKKVEGNVSNWTKENVTLRIVAEDTLSGIKEYSFDGGATWQASNEKTYSENTENIVIKVRDDLGNIAENVPISITKIDKEAPTIEKAEGNPSNWTKENVTLKVAAEDTLSGIKEYSFDGGKTWQTSNEKVFTENKENIVIKVRDNAGNIKGYDPISITKIMKLEKIEIRKTPTKTEYIEEENFSTEGMKVVAVYNNKIEEEIESYTVTNGNKLKLGQESVVIKYIENGVEKTVEQAIVVKEKLNPGTEDYEIIEEEGIKYIGNIVEKTTIKQLKEKIKTNGEIEVYKGNIKATDENTIIGTGMIIKIKLDSQEETYEAVIKGDITGDGQVKMADLLKLARYHANLDENLTGAYLKAGDVVQNGKIGMPDILKLSRVLAELDEM